MIQDGFEEGQRLSLGRLKIIQECLEECFKELKKALKRLRMVMKKLGHGLEEG